MVPTAASFGVGLQMLCFLLHVQYSLNCMRACTWTCDVDCLKTPHERRESADLVEIAKSDSYAVTHGNCCACEPQCVVQSHLCQSVCAAAANMMSTCHQCRLVQPIYRNRNACFRCPVTLSSPRRAVLRQVTVRASSGKLLTAFVLCTNVKG